MVGESSQVVTGPFGSAFKAGVDDQKGKDILGPANGLIEDGRESPTEEKGRCKLTIP